MGENFPNALSADCLAVGRSQLVHCFLNPKSCHLSVHAAGRHAGNVAKDGEEVISRLCATPLGLVQLPRLLRRTSEGELYSIDKHGWVAHHEPKQGQIAMPITSAPQ